MAGPTVKFVGEVSDEEKWKLMAGAKAYISPSEFEDFGVLNVEVMAAGTPVIALGQGGALESIVDGKTGVFFSEPNVESLTKAIKKFEKMKFKPEDCRRQAEKFSKERFVKEIEKFVTNKVK
jgi:glycosyltransferase involved in cell wall biosynthesis